MSGSVASWNTSRCRGQSAAGLVPLGSHRSHERDRRAREIRLNPANELPRGRTWAGWFAFCVPYVTIPAGLHGLRSAWAAILLYHAGMLAMLAASRRRDAWTALARGWNPAWGFAAIVLSGALGPVFLLLRPWLGLDGLGLARALERFGLTGFSWSAFAVYYATLHPVLEKAYWHGLLAPRVRRPLLADGAFAGYHGLVLALFVPWVGAAIAVLGLWIVAVAWRQTANHLGGLAVPLASHVVADLGLMLALALSLSGANP